MYFSPLEVPKALLNFSTTGLSEKQRYPSGTIDTVLLYKADRYFPHIAAIGDAGTSLGVAVWLPSGSKNRFQLGSGNNYSMSSHALMPQVGS
jgi:hypothetical protein